MKKIIVLIILALCLAGCTDLSKITTDDLEKITLELDEVQTTSEGIEYDIKLVNGSEFTIKQNTVHLSYPIKVKGGTKGNSYQVEATNNKLNVKPGEEVLLHVFTPFEGMDTHTSWSLDEVDIKMVGYVDEVKGENFFSIGIGTQINSNY